VNVALWIGMLAFGPLFGGIAGLSLVLGPLWVGMGMAIGVSARLASTWSCPKCAGELAPGEAADPRSVRPRGLSPHAA
jgi:hypothetical protein